MPNAGEAMKQQELLLAAWENSKWDNCFGKTEISYKTNPI